MWACDADGMVDLDYCEPCAVSLPVSGQTTLHCVDRRGGRRVVDVTTRSATLLSEWSPELSSGFHGSITFARRSATLEIRYAGLLVLDAECGATAVPETKGVAAAVLLRGGLVAALTDGKLRLLGSGTGASVHRGSAQKLAVVAREGKNADIAWARLVPMTWA